MATRLERSYLLSKGKNISGMAKAVENIPWKPVLFRIWSSTGYSQWLVFWQRPYFSKSIVFHDILRKTQISEWQKQYTPKSVCF